LVTLTGPGGAGKTRLSLEIAAREAPSGGAWFADLSAVRDPAQVEEVVATAVGAREEPGRPLAQTLVERFRAEPALVVFDNCEQVLDSAATLVRTLLSGCPDLKVLATSREPLSVAGERVWPVQQLPAEDALRLFEERATAVRPDFKLDAGNRATVDRISERLDRIPLAIELAAARTRVLAPSQILERLQDRFRLLSSADRSADPRQRTLRAAIDWSYTLLEAEERALFESLSVFSGSFDLEATEVIAGAAAVDAVNALDVLERLVDKSLVATLEAGGSSRYRMLETLHEYAAERLRDAGRTDAVERAHLAHFLAWVERLRKLNDRGVAGRRFGLDLANVRAAHATAERLEPELGLKLAVTAAPFWPMHGFVHEAAAWLERALESTPTPDAYAHHELGWLLYYAGDGQRAAAAFERGATLAETAGDGQLAGRCLNGAALSHLRLSEFEAAEAVLRRSIPVLVAAGDYLGLGQAHHYLAGIALLRARWADMLAESQTALEFRRRAGDPTDVAQSEAFTGIALTRLGELAEGRQALLRALEVVGPALDRPNLPDALDATAQLAVEVGDVRFAVRLAAACQAMQDEVGMSPLADRTPWVDLAPARATLGPEAEGVWEEGYALPLEAAVEEALRWLREASPTGGRPAPPPPASAL
jgi:non-specific serine/threonine protein kinase